MKFSRWTLVTGLASTSLVFAAAVSMGSLGCSSSSGTPSGGAGGGGGAGGAAGGSGAGGGGGSSAQPTITISSPTNGATVAATAGAHKTVPITFTVTNFTLKAPGTCAGAANCGHVHETTDGAACTQGSYNNAFNGSPGNVWLDLCPTVDGSHTTKLELHNDDHSLYTCGGSCSAGISATVQYTATGP